MLRKSTEMFNRRSITSSLAFRRKTISRESGSSGTGAKAETVSRGTGLDSQPDIGRQLTPSEPVEITDIVDDVEDILDKKKVNGAVDRRSEPKTSVKPKELIKASNAMSVKDFEMNKNNSEKTAKETA